MSILATLTENVSTSTVDFSVGVIAAILEMEWRIAQVAIYIAKLDCIARTQGSPLKHHNNSNNAGHFSCYCRR